MYVFVWACTCMCLCVCCVCVYVCVCAGTLSSYGHGVWKYVHHFICVCICVCMYVSLYLYVWRIARFLKRNSWKTWDLWLALKLSLAISLFQSWLHCLSRVASDTHKAFFHGMVIRNETKQKPHISSSVRKHSATQGNPGSWIPVHGSRGRYECKTQTLTPLAWDCCMADLPRRDLLLLLLTRLTTKTERMS